MTKAVHGSSGDSEHLLEQLLSAIPDDLVRFTEWSEKVEDWDEVLSRALQHSVESVVHYYLAQTGQKLPPAIEERSHRWQSIKNVWQAHAQSALNEVLGALGSASVRTVALKGPILAERLYPDPHMRLSADLDLLVAAADLDKALTILNTIGYGAAKEAETR